jgi:hypothetical protein
VNLIVLQTILLVWLLLICGSQTIVAQNSDTLYPKLLIDKPELDICKSEKNFIITVDLGKALKISDSVIAVELQIGFDKDKIILDGVYYMGTLFEQFTDFDHFYKIIENPNSKYDYMMIEGGNILRPTYNPTKNVPLVYITGRMKTDDIDCGEIFIRDLYINEECKLFYDNYKNDTARVCLLAKNLPERTVYINPEEENYKIECEEAVNIKYNLEISNIKNFKSFQAEFTRGTEFIDITNFTINDNFKCEIINKEKDKYIVDCVVKDTTKLANNIEFINLILMRNSNDSSLNTIESKISNINQSSCSMNSKGQIASIKCSQIVSITENNNKDIDISYLENNIIRIASNNRINDIKIYDVLGRKIDYIMEKQADEIIIINLQETKRGLYFIEIQNPNKIHFNKLKIN